MQFSLRTVLVVLTACCAGLSVWVAPAERQRRAVVAIEAAGGSVVWDGDPEPAHQGFASNLLERWLPKVYSHEVKGVLGISNSALANLRALRSLEMLVLTGAEITDAGLAHLDGLTRLELLDLSNTQISDAGLTHLKEHKSLELLFLSKTQITDAGLTNLENLTRLEVISLRDTRTTDDGLASFERLTSLTLLDLRDTQVTELGVRRLQKALPQCTINWP